MRILYIYRSMESGPSIRRVFQPIESRMRDFAEVDSIYLPSPYASISALCKNIRYAMSYVKKHDFDVIHITGDVYYLAYFLRKYKVVTTVHDLGFYTTAPQKTLRTYLQRCIWIKPLKYSSLVTFISEKSCNEALALEELKNTIVIPNAVYDNYQYAPKKLNDECPVILHLGTKPNKNLVNTIKALSGIECHLRIIGKIDSTIEGLLKNYNVNYSNASNLSDDEILEEYKKCDIVSFPSLYEGFGMPIIEGQAIGRPVLTSNLSPMREIAGGAAVLVNPNDVDSIRDGFIKVKEKSEEFVSKGLKNAVRYRVGEISQQYLQCYKLLHATTICKS